MVDVHGHEGVTAAPAPSTAVPGVVAVGCAGRRDRAVLPLLSGGEQLVDLTQGLGHALGDAHL
ncbi:hypothetical protein GCM10011594_33820 [Nakamurella endophytica]|uniref:Uncharacterized protein n=1 Tax=Nakamurella endophytica TaxID=1748367 RepID=A0A917T5D6_9ACTN|nr:hypothetical protein GCM10011594_33820 [Nakamurella endophytica]